MLFTKKDLIKITLPLILQQLLNVLVSTVDSIMVANVGEEAVSGIALVGSLDTVLITFFTALTTGGTVIISQFLGKKNARQVKEATKQTLYISTLAAAALAVTVLIFRVPMLNLLFGDAEPGVMYHARRYFFFIALSFPFLAIDGACGSALRAAGDSMTSMLVSFGMNLVNVAGNALLIYAIPLGAAGAAIATLAARVAGSIVLIAMLHTDRWPVKLERLFHYRPDWKIIRRILHIGVPNGIESCMFQFGRLMTQSLISGLGTVSIAANSIANTLANYQYLPGAAIGNASIAVIGRCVGAKETKQAKRYSRILLLTAYCCIWVIVLVTLLFGKAIIGAWKLSPESAALTFRLILLHSLAAAVIWPSGFVLPHMFRAASDVKFPMTVSITSMWVFRIALCFVLVPESIHLFGLTVPGLGMGVIGVWIAMIIDWLVRAALYLWRFFSGRWLAVYKE